MNTPEEAFGKLLGRQPTDKENQDLYRVRDALNLKNNDAVWMLLMVLGHYETVYGKFPGLIAKAAADTVDKTKAAADAELKAAAARVKEDLAQTVAKSARDIAEQTASASRWQWICAAVVLSASLFVLVGTLSYRSAYYAGSDAGSARGYAEARHEQAAASWANTPEGQLAYALAGTASIRELATCSGRGWVRKGNLCYLHGDKEFVFGWKLPSETSRARAGR